MNLKNAFDFLHIKECESTQDEALALAHEKKSSVLVLSDIQTKGRGRRGREWVSAPENSLLMTLAVPEKVATPYASVFSLYAGAVLYITLLDKSEKFSALTLKWPNDLGIYEKEAFRKTAGLLVEFKKGYFLLGVGMNLKGATPYKGALSLSEISDIYIDRVDLAKAYAEKLLEGLTAKHTQDKLLEFLSNKAMQKLWNKTLGAKWENHIAKGLAGEGALISQSPSGKTEVIYSGDI